MRPWLSELFFFDDLVPHGAPLNMAIDEALLGGIPGPVLRVYRWERPAVSFGYFERWAPIRLAHPDREPVRRWTGGGIVLHGEDLTYSLLIPSAAGLGRPPVDTYALIHGALCAALADAGIPAATASVSVEKISEACFENPVRHDVLVGGKKVAGAAQRRTRAGLIHQGSIQSLVLPADFGLTFTTRLAAQVREACFDVIAAAETLAAEKYGTAAWLAKRL